jgi:molybdopterin/thiamine biosynthesis adenylyltransferase
MVDAIDPLSRYARQAAFAPLGPDGQKRLRLTGAVLVGCGALGGATAELLVRAGIGGLRIIDRDIVELGNLQRQTLFDESDASEGIPKSEAAARRLRRINSGVEIESVVADVRPDNAAELLGNADLILDGLDNFETRYLVNDFAVQTGVPWIYGACLGAEARVLPILPQETPCLRCVWPDAPAPGTTETCATAGIIGPAVAVAAALQASAAIRILTGRILPADCRLIAVDVWSNRWQQVDVLSGYEPDACPACGARRFDFLNSDAPRSAAVLCGRDSVQITPARPASLNLAQLAAKLPAHTRAKHNRFVVRFHADGHDVTVFPDGRALVGGTSDVAVAQRVYATFVGA